MPSGSVWRHTTARWVSSFRTAARASAPKIRTICSKPFYRGRDALERQIQGSGLGLSLVDHIAREHGGRVEVRSTPGEGSRFTLWLPAEEGASP